MQRLMLINVEFSNYSLVRRYIPEINRLGGIAIINKSAPLVL